MVWKVVIYFKNYPKNFSKVTEKIHEIVQTEYTAFRSKSNMRLPECEEEMLTTTSQIYITL